MKANLHVIFFLIVTIFIVASAGDEVIDAGMATMQKIAEDQKVIGMEEIKNFFSIQHPKALEFANKEVQRVANGKESEGISPCLTSITFGINISQSVDKKAAIIKGIQDRTSDFKIKFEFDFESIYEVLGVGISYTFKDGIMFTAIGFYGITPVEQRTYTTNIPYSIIVLGAAGDLASKKTYPALWKLYLHGFLPILTKFFAFSKSVPDYKKIKENCNVPAEISEIFDKFWKLQTRVVKTANECVESDFLNIGSSVEAQENNRNGNRIFYFALPAEAYYPAATHIKKICEGMKGWKRLILEKPFGHDSESSKILSDQLLNELKYEEDELYRIDHFLGKDMVQNLVNLRLKNKDHPVFKNIWERESPNKNHKVASVLITCEEDFGTHKRGPYFDKYGIVRDIIQNHLMQVFSLIAMDITPRQKQLEKMLPEEIRDAKVQLLVNVAIAKPEETILGQYIHNTEELTKLKIFYDKQQAQYVIGISEQKMSIPESVYNYREDLPENVAQDSKTPTFATTVLHIENDSWRGVPFILRCGKALKEKKTEIRIQFRGKRIDGAYCKEELVILVQPAARVVLRTLERRDYGAEYTVTKEVDLTYKSFYEHPQLLEAYERLILDVFHGRQENMVRYDELEQAWRIVSQILHKFVPEQDTKASKPASNSHLEREPFKYVFGTHGPKECDDFYKQFLFRSPNVTLMPKAGA